MHCLRYPQMRVLLQQHLWMYQKGLMPQKLLAFDVLRAIVLLCTLLEDVTVLFCDRIPDLWLSLMDVVDRREIKVFFMPTEKGFPGANIAVRFSNSLYPIRHRVLQKRIEGVHVPTSSCFVH